MTCRWTRRIDVYGTMAANVAQVLAETGTDEMSALECLARELMAEGRLDRRQLHETPELSAVLRP